MLHSSSSDEDEYDGRDCNNDDPDFGNITHYPVPSPRHVKTNSNSGHGGGHNNRDRDSIGSGSHIIYQGSGQYIPTKSNHSGSGSGSPTSTSRAPSFENPKIGGSSFETVSISSGYSVPQSFDGNSCNTPRHDRYSNCYSHSRSNSFRGSDRSPQQLRRPGSPTASIISDREREDLEKLSIEEDDHRRRLQVYVFVLRCVAFPFNAKQPHDMQRRQAKISKQELNKIKDRFNAFLKGETSIMADEAFKNAVQSYYEVFLKSDRVTSMVKSGACSANDFREVFKNNIEKRVKQLPEIDGLSKETVLSSWMTKFDTIYRGDESDARKHHRSVSTANELILSKDQLYEMFQNILNIRKYEHLILYNALQLDNPDEQAAQVRRELASRQQQLDSGAYKMKPWKPRFVVKDMEQMFRDELNSQILQLKANLESVPVKGGALQKNAKKPGARSNSNSMSKIDVVDENEQILTKPDIVLSFTVEVIIMEVKGLKLPGNKNIYCTMELDGKSDNKLQTDLTPASKPSWGAQGDFTTTQPLPVVKIKLFQENSGLLSIEDRELGKVLIRPKATNNKTAQNYKMTTPKNIQEDIHVKAIIKMEKTQNMKYCGFLYALGKKVWRTCKNRYFVLVQVSQYAFAVCSYKEKKAEPVEMLQLKGYTVDYCDSQPEMDCEAQYFFNAVKEGDSVTFATTDENERHNWVQALYRATGQSHKPTPPTVSLTNNGTKAPNQPHLPKVQGEIDKARRHGLDEFVSTDPCEFPQSDLFRYLQHRALEYRMGDAFTCLGWFSPGQVYILDEYAARYGVRGCHRHLCYLSDLLEKAENGLMIDPTLMHYSFAFCASHVYGNKPDGLGTITIDERQRFEDIRSRLRALLEHQITHFRYCFPFGRPEGALKATLSLLERVLMKDMGSPIAVEEVRNVIRKCLENAALVNYTRISEFAKIEDSSGLTDEASLNREHLPDLEYSKYKAAEDDSPLRRLENVTHVASLCIEVLQQNEEHHAEAFTWFSDVWNEHNEMFWSLFAVDMDSCLEEQPPDTWESFSLFSLLNSYLLTDRTLKGGKFHNHLRDVFAPQVVRYVDLMESSIAQSIDRGFSRERWEAHGTGCATSQEMLWKLDALQTFIKELQWPEEVFAEHLEHRLKLMASDMIEAAGNRTLKAFDEGILRVAKSADFIIPSEICVMVNTLSDCKAQAMKLCIMSGESMHQYHTRIEEFLETALKHTMETLIGRLMLVLDNTLFKLKRFDEGSFLKSLLTLTKPTDELGKGYVCFVRGNLDMVRQRTTDEIYVNSLFENWYTRQIKRLCEWLSERLEMPLHPYQLTCLIHIMRKLFSDFELQGVPNEALASKTYHTVCNRLTVEEATQACMESRNIRMVTGMSVDNEDNE